mgnify:FL=1
MRTREDNIGIYQMTVLLRAGYPLSPRLQAAIAELVSEAARAARKSREPGAPPRQGKKKK